MKEKKGMRARLLLTLGCLATALMVSVMPLRAEAGTTQNDTSNPYVHTFTCPDGTVAWTIVEDLPKEEIIPYQIYKSTNTKPSFWGSANDYIYFRDAKINDVHLEVGQHFYKKEVDGVVELAGWKMNHVDGRCIHQTKPIGIWHGYDFKPDKVGEQLKNCYYAYPSGWMPVCADCGEVLSTAHVYATKTALQTIDKFDTASPYYFICYNENCRGLENSGDVHHDCQFVSWNKYKVVYEKNASGVTGVTADTYHMYGNKTEYEGYEIDPVTHLANSGFRRYGYTVVEWNTKPDGSGTTYELGYEIPDNAPLSTEQYDKETGKGIITLYAIWEETTSTLNIDPNGGSYDGRKDITSITKGYGYDEIIAANKFVAPDGYNTKFNSNGGTPCPDKKQSTHFDRIERKDAENFHGKLNKVGDDYKYEFLGENRSIDTVIARYEGDPIILPTPTKEGFSFGGWYKDPDLKEFVGGGGDPYTPDANRTLYAAWTKLVLDVVENYVANNKKGASDLTWTDENHVGKYYKIFRSLDGKDFEEMLDAADSFDIDMATRSYGYTGGLQTYTVQATGYYVLKVGGAEGGSYGSFEGGLGGEVEGKFYLKKGDVLEIKVGGAGYGGGQGGAAALKGGNGGGGTSVSIKNGPILLVAGGGGGATDGDNGKEGGADDGVRAASYSASTMAGENASESGGGGGGGYIGGMAGSNIVHEHTDECKIYHKHNESCYTSKEHTHYCHSCQGKTVEQQYALGWHATTCCGATHRVTLWCNARDKGDPWCWGHTTCTATQCYGSWHANGMTYCNTADGLYAGKKDVLTCELTYSGDQGYFTGYGCGYKDDEVVGIKGAYGGSNFVATSCVSSTKTSGTHSGNGYFEIAPASFGVSGELFLNGVPSPDLKAPAKIDELSVEIKPISTTQGEVLFDMPEDFGTEYYWYVKSYYVTTDVACATSNTCKDELITGIAGYRYVYDRTKTHGEDYIAALNSGFGELSAPEHRNDGGVAVKRPKLSVTRYDEDAYLHIAPVDVAGNVGPTIDILVEPAEQDWTVVTTPMLVSDNLNGTRLGTVYTVGDLNYVRADGTGVFKLSYDSFLDTKAKSNYQIDYQLIDINPSTPGTAQIFESKIPYSALQETVKVPASSFERYMSGTNIFTDICNTGVTRLNTARKNAFFQCFTIPASFDGKLMYATPVAGVTDKKGDVIYSKWESDVLNAAKIMPDAKAPVVTGFESLAGMTAISKNEPGVPDYLTISATDALSGVKSLSVVVTNQSNGLVTNFYPDASGKITIPLGAVADDDVTMNGDLVFKVTAIDNVGNTYVATYGAEIFALDTKLVNAYDPTTNVVPQGGAALLGMVTRGYAEVLTVELHDKLKPGNEGIQLKWIYNPTSYAQYETLTFGVPSDCPPGTYQVTVKATKNGGADVLFDYPDLVVVAGGPDTGEVHVRIR